MESQERILQKATDLFIRYGIRSVTMDEIAIQLGISKKTIYQFYEDKNELVSAVMEQYLQHNRNCCNRDRQQAKNAIHEIFLAMEMIEGMFENMNSSMLYDLEKYHPKAYQKFERYKNEFLHKVIRENLEKGIDEELYRDDIDKNILTVIRLETMVLPFNQDVFPKSKYNLAEVHQQLMEHYLFGIASVKGHKMILKYKEERNKVKQ
jgi:TetR/AcrR family transcriptional regulator, cholesterol catabolism regulator